MCNAACAKLTTRLIRPECSGKFVACPRAQSASVAGGIGKSISEWPVQVEEGAKSPREPTGTSALYGVPQPRRLRRRPLVTLSRDVRIDRMLTVSIPLDEMRARNAVVGHETTRRRASGHCGLKCRLAPSGRKLPCGLRCGRHQPREKFRRWQSSEVSDLA